jgi:hypothetical protein
VLLCERPRRKQYVREWALAQAANGLVDYDNITLEISPSPEQAMVFAEKDNPIYLAKAFEIVAAMIEGKKAEHAFRTGSGGSWGDSSGCLFPSALCEQLSRTGCPPLTELKKS